MPIFDYVCTCGEKVADKLVRNSETIVDCPACSKSMQKQTTATKYLLLCGGGFYDQHDAPNPNW